MTPYTFTTSQAAPLQVPAVQGVSADTDVLARYRAAVARVDALIERSPTPEGKSAAEIRERAELRLDRVRRFLAELGNPQAAYPVVHVGGTSGKGSTSTAIAAMLAAGGYRTGLHTSPYLQAASEKLQVNGRLIAPDAFAELVDEVMAAHDAWVARDGEALSYGEIWVALLAVFFARERVDIAVIEVGAGGRFDLTNVVKPAVSVITSVGLDHMVTLGASISEIAWHKAGIIKAGAPVITAVTAAEALAPIVAEAESVGAPIVRVEPGETFEVIGTDAGGTRWREAGDGGLVWEIGLPGRFQATNGATALAAVRALASAGFPVSEAAMRAGLAATRIPGRFETVQDRPRVILDGAHNEEKVGALAADLGTLIDRKSGARLIVVLGVLEAKRYEGMVRLLLSHADELIATSPSVLAKPGIAATALARAAGAAGFGGPIAVETEPRAAVARAMRAANPDRGDVVLVTGSLYLAGNVRSRWFPDDAIVRRRWAWADA